MEFRSVLLVAGGYVLPEHSGIVARRYCHERGEEKEIEGEWGGAYVLPEHRGIVAGHCCHERGEVKEMKGE